MIANEVIAHMITEAGAREEDITSLGKVLILSGAKKNLPDYDSKRDVEGTCLQDEITTETSHHQYKAKRRESERAYLHEIMGAKEKIYLF